MNTTTTWQDICASDDLVNNSGVCAIINGQQVALFFIDSPTEPQVFAVQNYDPIGNANVLYRGLLGSVEDNIVVASPLYKQRYCLSNGKCLDDETIILSTFAAKIEHGRVLVDHSQNCSG